MGAAQTEGMTSPAARSFFGWRIVIALFLAMFALFGVAIYAFIVFIQPLATRFGWSAAQSGSLVSAMWLVAPLALVSATFTRRVSPWRLIVVGLCIQALAIASLGLISAFWQLYLLRMVMGVGKVFTATAAPVIVSRWFSRRFGAAISLVWAGGAAGGLTMAPLSQWLIARWGAQTASLAVAAGVLLLVVAVVLMARGPSSPAEIGVALDGAPQAAGVTPDPDAAEGRAAALRDIPPLTAFIMLVSVVGAGMASIAVLTQEPLLFKQAKLSTEVAALLLGLTAGGGLIGSATIGWMLDRLHGLWSSAVVALTIFLGVLAFSVLLHQPTAVAGALGALSLGYGFGAGEVLWIALTKRQLGQAVFPFTYGAWYFALQVGYGLGGGIAGWSYQSFGAAGFLAFVALIYALPALCSLTLKGGRLPAAGRASS